MRYLGGYSEQEIAETLDVTERTVQRDWEKRKADPRGGAAVINEQAARAHGLWS
jgi:DNA-binding transcriptional regulator YiaG